MMGHQGTQAGSLWLFLVISHPPLGLVRNDHKPPDHIPRCTTFSPGFPLVCFTCKTSVKARFLKRINVQDISRSISDRFDKRFWFCMQVYNM